MTLAKSASYINVNIYSLSPVFLSLEAVILLFSGDNLDPALGSRMRMRRQPLTGAIWRMRSMSSDQWFARNHLETPKPWPRSDKM